MRFLAYFDYLGFKDFIDRNDSDSQQRAMLNNFVNIESALANGKVKRSDYGVILDLSTLKLGCTNFSDTVLFWTKDNTIDSLKCLLTSALRFNWQCIDYNFPVRGSIVYGEFNYIDYTYKTGEGGSYNINSIFGKALIEAYNKAESQNWAGSVIDESVMIFLKENGQNPDTFLVPYAKRFMVPYNDAVERQQEEWVLHLVTSTGKISEEGFNNMSRNIRENFGLYRKSVEHPRVQQKITNTLNFLSSYR
jgi:hypothetical protein